MNLTNTWKWVKVIQFCPTLCNLMDYTVHVILQARILEWAAFPFSRESSWPRNQIRVSCIAVDSLPTEPQGKAKNTGVGRLSLLQKILLIQESNRGLLHCSGFFINWAIREAPFSPNSTLSRRFFLLPLNQLGSFSLESALSFGNASWWPTLSPLCQGYLCNWVLTFENCKLVVCSKMGSQCRFVDLSRTQQDLRSFWW